jgi:hypothetical protein
MLTHMLILYMQHTTPHLISYVGVHFCSKIVWVTYVDLKGLLECGGGIAFISWSLGAHAHEGSHYIIELTIKCEAGTFKASLWPGEKRHGDTCLPMIRYANPTR